MTQCRWLPLFDNQQKAAALRRLRRTAPDIPTLAGFATCTVFTNFLKENAMNQISDIMTREVRCVAPNDSLQRAAKIMGELDVGSLPVWDGQNLIGMVTDRDITIRGVAQGKQVDSAAVSEVMSTDVQWCFEDDQIDEVMEKMQDAQIRRVPVMDRQNRLIGMVSLGDLATKTRADEEVQDTLESVSQPSEPNRSTLH
jgi:CBS domain-containing protein